MCGENQKYSDAYEVGGLIPACAGKTGLEAGDDLVAWAHPRVCGENSTSGPKSIDAGGSSPRVRGKLSAVHGEHPHLGLIPACAGKTCW